MRKLLIITALLLFAGLTFGQTLQKGAVLGMHTVTLTLSPGVTVDQYQDFINNKMIPEWEKHFPGAKGFIGKGLNRENKDEFAMLIVVESKKVYNIYWNDDGSATDEGAAAQEKMLPIAEEMNKLATYTTVITDWMIQ
jgi:hypothetical protein